MNEHGINSLWEALIMIGLCVLTGIAIGSVFHFWPMPVNESVLIKNK